MIEKLIQLLHLPEEPEECKFKDTCKNYNQDNLECQRYYNDRKEYCFDSQERMSQDQIAKAVDSPEPDTSNLLNGIADNFKKNWGRS